MMMSLHVDVRVKPPASLQQLLLLPLLLFSVHVSHAFSPKNDVLGYRASAIEEIHFQAAFLPHPALLDLLRVNRRAVTKLKAGPAVVAPAAQTVVTRGVGCLFSAIKLCLRELGALTAIQSSLFLATFSIGIMLGRTKPFWRRYTSVLDIPSSCFGPASKMLKGRAVKVSDGDTLRFLHVPSPLNKSELEKGQKLSKFCLPIRICTIDTPETAKFGKSGQPFGTEAKERMRDLCEKKMIRVRLLHKDQYGRGVGSVVTGRWPFRRPVDEIMLKEGLAEVYQGAGAVYGSKGLQKYLQIEDDARRRKVGIWSLDNRESAAEYKRRTK